VVVESELTHSPHVDDRPYAPKITQLSEGQRVAVDMVEGGKGPEAVGIRLV
jgi:hypothetical protein